VLPDGATVKVIGAALGHELDLRRAFTGALGADAGGRDRDFLDRIGSRHDRGKEAIVGAQQVVLDIEAVDRNIHRALGESVDGGRSRCARSRGARLRQDELEQVARGYRQFDQLLADERGTDGRTGSLYDFRAGGDVDSLADCADLEFDVDRRGYGC